MSLTAPELIILIFPMAQKDLLLKGDGRSRVEPDRYITRLIIRRHLSRCRSRSTFHRLHIYVHIFLYSLYLYLLFQMFNYQLH